MNSEGSALDYAALGVQMRAPRVAIVIPDRLYWPRLVGNVLEQCVSLWGGAGFILVPHRDGVVTPLWRRVVNTYDPDHVVAAEVPLADLAEISPDDYPVTTDGERLSVDRIREIDASAPRPLSEFDDSALEAAVSACSPFFDDLGHRDDVVRVRLTKGHLRAGRGLSAVEVSGSDSVAVDFSSHESAFASVWLRSNRGIVWPIPTATLPSTDPEADALRNLIDGHALADQQQSDWSASPGWASSMTGLASLLTWEARDNTWIVVGSTFDDFALSHALSRIANHCLWLPSDWLESSSPWFSVARRLLSREHGQSDGGAVRVTSTSMSPADALALCATAESYHAITDGPSWLTSAEIDSLPFAGERRLLALSDDYDRDLVLPIRRSDRGDVALVSRLPALLPETAAVATLPIEWVTDVRFLEHAIPSGRAYPSRSLQATDNVWIEHLRSGRDGLSLMSMSNGFVAAGSTRRQSTARPRLVVPSLATWLATLAERSGHSVSTSQAGHTAALTTALWPSRQALADDVAARRPLFEAFLSSTDSHSERYPNGDGYLLGHDGYPLLDALVSAGAICGLDAEATREVVDRLLLAKTVRRGLIVRCGQCSKEQFISAPKSADGGTCVRCRRAVALVHGSWSPLHDEPRWYYDLDPIARQFLIGGGDVAPLAERHLRGSRRGLDGIPEFDIRWADGASSEIDMLCGSSDAVIVGECKVQPEIPARDRAKKIAGLVRTAALMQATEIVLAAGDPGMWSETVVDRLQRAIRGRDWPSGRAPQLRLLSGLRTSSVTDVIAPSGRG